MAHDIAVEMDPEPLQQPVATTAEQQGMLGLTQAEVVNGGQQVSLEAPLTDQTLVQGEGEASMENGEKCTAFSNKCKACPSSNLWGFKRKKPVLFHNTH